MATGLLMLRSGSRVHVAEREAETIRREAQIEAREQAVKLRAEIENEVQDRRAEAAKIEERVAPAEHELDAQARPRSSGASRASPTARCTSSSSRRS